ncbi:PAS domain S-box protein [Gloeocapsa sp. BRSZ]
MKESSAPSHYLQQHFTKIPLGILLSVPFLLQIFGCLRAVGDSSEDSEPQAINVIEYHTYQQFDDLPSKALAASRDPLTVISNHLEKIQHRDFYGQQWQYEFASFKFRSADIAIHGYNAQNLNTASQLDKRFIYSLTDRSQQVQLKHAIATHSIETSVDFLHPSFVNKLAAKQSLSTSTDLLFNLVLRVCVSTIGLTSFQGSLRASVIHALIRTLLYRDKSDLDSVSLITPESELRRDINNQHLQILAGCCLTVVLALFAWLLITRRLIKPRRYLAKIEAIAHKQFAQVATPRIDVTQLINALPQINRVILPLEPRDRLQNLTNALPGIIYTAIIEPDGLMHFKYINQATETFYEISAQEFLTQPNRIILAQMHPEDRTGFLKQLAYQRQALATFTHEWRSITPSGKLMWLRATAQPQKREGNIYWHGMILDISDLKQREQALQASHAQLNNILNSAGVAIAQLRFYPDRTFDTDYRTAGCNAIVGYTPEELTAQLWASRIPTEDLQAISAQAFAGVSQEQPVTVEYRFRRKDGSQCWIADILTSRWDENAGCWKVTAVGVDITDRKNVETALHQSEALNRAILKTLPDLIVRMHQDGTYLDVKPTTAFPILTSPNLIGSNIRDVLPPDTAQQRLAAAATALSTKQMQVYEFPLVVAGQWLWQEARVMPLTTDEVLIVIRDLTQRKQAEQALQENEQQFRQAFDDAPIGMALILITGEFRQVNRSLCEIVGYAEAELLALTIADITHPDDRQTDTEYRQQLLAGTLRCYEIEKRYVRKQGDIVQTFLNVSLVKDAAQQPLYFIAQILNVSDRYEIARMKDEFIAIVSHELRTPLTAIRGSLGILATGVLDDEPLKVQELLQIALNNSDRLMRLVDDILNLERLESGKIPLTLESCEVGDLIQQAIACTATIADAANIKISTLFPTIQIQVASDAIVQTLTNLLSNAVKFSPSGSTVWLNAEVRDNDDTATFTPYILFSVKDQGRGIPADKIETIFRRFQQVDISDSRQKRGTGLGLAICKSIVQQHGGQIWVKSQQGVGSTFYFTLPIAQPE